MQCFHPVIFVYTEKPQVQRLRKAGGELKTNKSLSETSAKPETSTTPFAKSPPALPFKPKVSTLSKVAVGRGRLGRGRGRGRGRGFGRGGGPGRGRGAFKRFGMGRWCSFHFNFNPVKIFIIYCQVYLFQAKFFYSLF